MKDLINLCILSIICNFLFFSQWQQQLDPCKTSTSLQICLCFNQLYNRNYCSYHSNHSQVYIIVENMEKTFILLHEITNRIDAGEDPKTLPLKIYFTSVMSNFLFAPCFFHGGDLWGVLFSFWFFMTVPWWNRNSNILQKKQADGGSAHKHQRLNQLPSGIYFVQILIWMLGT